MELLFPIYFLSVNTDTLKAEMKKSIIYILYKNGNSNASHLVFIF